MEILNVSREDFPKSRAFAEGMKVINPECDNFETVCHYDVKYTNNGKCDLYLQIIQPINMPDKTPVIIFIPGSAFHKQDVRARVPQLGLLAARGFCVALLEYTPSEVASFPQLIRDAKEGIAFMKKNAERFNVDPQSVFMMGYSSGGYTALMAGLSNIEEESGEDYSVKGIIDFFAPTNITTMNNEPSTMNHSEPNSPEGFLIGQKDVQSNPGIAEKTVIKNYISRDRKYPPVLMFHGSNDELVPFGQSCELYSALKQNGIKAELYQIEGAHHGDRQFWSSDVLDMIEWFINTVDGV
ncbi:MAG: alpha/beta hydrolase [Oscillospiraceae bacterium]|nr:alpha/beta hydrolase [Oscillospiraceae bacterium]